MSALIEVRSMKALSTLARGNAGSVRRSVSAGQARLPHAGFASGRILSGCTARGGIAT